MSNSFSVLRQHRRAVRARGHTSVRATREVARPMRKQAHRDELQGFVYQVRAADHMVMRRKTAGDEGARSPSCAQAPRVWNGDVCLPGTPAHPRASAEHNCTLQAFVQQSTMSQPVSSIGPEYLSSPQILFHFLFPRRTSPFFGGQRAATSCLVRAPATQ